MAKGLSKAFSRMNIKSQKSDVLIIGSGIAGLSLALKLPVSMTVHIVTKREAVESNTRYAQGGIAAVLSATDNLDSHVQDTLTAGAGLCHEDVVRKIIGDGPRLVRELLDYGVKFSRNEKDELDLGREGGHSERRVAHAGDMTGQELERALLAEAHKRKNIHFFEHHFAVDLLLSDKIQSGCPRECLGAYVLNSKNGEVLPFEAGTTILATGGAGKVYLYTSNPDVATGDGMAMAYRAGAALANMEFVQFHPTCLYNPGGLALAANRPVPEGKTFLVSEAVRGEGATLKRADGSSFMDGYHPLKELAPRDVVARAIDYEMKKSGDRYVLLDISMKGADFIQKRFPNIDATCHAFGFDMTKGPIPVVPAAHYFCGGVRTDMNGATNIPSLYAIGECAFTGLHGANRLASNSLLEGVAMADYAAKVISAQKHKPSLAIPPWNAGEATSLDEAVVITQNWEEIRRFMWNYVGIVRTDKRLARARTRVKMLQDEVHEYYWNFKVTPDILELRNLAEVAGLVIECALQRKESRGLHYTLDYPEILKDLKDTIVQK